MNLNIKNLRMAIRELGQTPNGDGKGSEIRWISKKNQWVVSPSQIAFWRYMPKLGIDTSDVAVRVFNFNPLKMHARVGNH